MAKRIVVVNHTWDMLELYDVLLSPEGYEVIPEKFNTHALPDIARYSPDLVILDYVFGIEEYTWKTLRKLRTDHLTASTPIIICTTANRFILEMDEFLSQANVSVLSKPFDVADLLDTIEQVLASKN